MAPLVAGVHASECEPSEDAATRPMRWRGLSERVAHHIADTRFDDLPPAAVAMAKRSLLDALGVSMAATSLEPACSRFIDLARDMGSGDALIPGTGVRSSAVMAALANGSLAHALDYEDAHDPTLTHPNAATVAAALSLLSPMRKTSGREFITAIAVGADLVCRLARARNMLTRLPTRFYPPALVGTFGATAAAGQLLNLDAQQVLDALSLTLCNNSCSAEILHSPYSDIRAVRDSFCAQSGVQAALLAGAGIRGFDAPLEGRSGFFTMYDEGNMDVAALTDRLGVYFEGERIGFKAWPACRATHPYIQSALEGMTRDRLDLTSVDRITVTVREADLIVCEPKSEKLRPSSPIDAKFSIYYTLAHAMLFEGVDLNSFTASALHDPATLELAAKIDYVIDDGQALAQANGGRPLVSIQRSGHTPLEWSIDALYGTPENPISDERLIGKFVDCGLTARVPADATTLRQLASEILSIEQHDNVWALISRL